MFAGKINVERFKNLLDFTTDETENTESTTDNNESKFFAWGNHFTKYIGVKSAITSVSTE
jgi:hypothetical protein